MATILMVYASMTGNTEDMADAIADGVRDAGIDITVKSVVDTNASELTEYDGILFGAYTWGDGELPDEFLDFYEEMDDVNLQGKKAAVFGSCDSSYSQVGAAVDILIEKSKEIGAEVTLEGLKIELSPSADEKETCRDFGKKFAQSL
ncbi:flavodoxin [Paenibacillus turpanensis]|uniref:flavodoxin n=1 Tax=Paenibacillus turpanensis TaxID=2689078 RepID=UPI00140B3A54|nr:flavodoxin [Paenibacillus turpanensis]